MIYTIDAQDKKIGRIASEAAHCLQGKMSPTYARNKASDDAVTIINASKADMSARKKERDTYVTYTGFRGGLNTETLGDLIKRRGMTKVFRRAVYNMLPSNKLRTERMKKLTITDYYFYDTKIHRQIFRSRRSPKD